MAANPTDTSHYYTLDEYFAIEHAGEARYEYWDGEIVCMSGGTLAHSRIASNLHRSLSQKLVNGPCEAFTSDLAIKTPALPPYRYPDLSVVRGEPQVENIRGVDVLLNPILIVEVLSPITERRDRGAKFSTYKGISTFCEYLMVSQETPMVSHAVKRSDFVWSNMDIAGLDQTIRLESVDCELSMTEIYRSVEFRL